ncbi:hypothetical protein F511_46183 [Dorcoceras hygrometricum]|uniref:Uncharacterized protein n=1 Tax=Dorcoceras hygrometricum TaxID=472368 RepID=A0A2Z6ZU85_9LAMI|nr:hypothetical protein F511_46183 [Dorcoceras hygrometricum]
MHVLTQWQAKPKAGRFLTTGTRRNPRNAAFPLNQTTSHFSLDWFLNSTAGHPVATQFLPRLVLQFINWSFSHERNDCQTQHKRNN